MRRYQVVITTPALIIPAMKRTHKGPKTALENRLMPTSIDLRDGTSRFSKAVFGPLWVRFIAGMISAGVVITTWYLLTGGLS